jgi:hypothetical protein
MSIYWWEDLLRDMLRIRHIQENMRIVIYKIYYHLIQDNNYTKNRQNCMSSQLFTEHNYFDDKYK